MIVVDVALPQPAVARVRVVDLFAQFAGGMERSVAISKCGIHIGVMRNHTTSGNDNPLGALFISLLQLALKRHLYVIPHLHRCHWRVIGFASVVAKEPLPQWKLLRHQGSKRTEQTQKKTFLEIFQHETSDAPALENLARQEE
jgi:hypothetical protein